VRLVCATNRNLTEMSKSGEFREDLLYRLNVVTIYLPALRHRQEDMIILLNHYIKEFSEENAVAPVRLTASALKVLRAYRWPGNIRELRNFCENNVVLKHGSEVTEYDLDLKYQVKAGGSQLLETVASSSTLSKEQNEKRLLRNALIKASGNRTRAAELMGISRRTLHRKLIQWPELDVAK